MSPSVAYVAGSSGFPYGQSGEIWRTQDGGARWRRIATVAGTVLAMDLHHAGDGLAVLESANDRMTSLIRLTPGERTPKTLRIVGNSARSAALAPGNLPINVRRAGGGRLVQVSSHAADTLATLPGQFEAIVFAAGSGMAAALSVTYAPSGARMCGHGQGTELLVRLGARWRLVRLPNDSGAPVDGWLPTGGQPGVPLLWRTVDGGLTRVALAPW